jgi:hypothetical protein
MTYYSTKERPYLIPPWRQYAAMTAFESPQLAGLLSRSHMDLFFPPLLLKLSKARFPQDSKRDRTGQPPPE